MTLQVLVESVVDESIVDDDDDDAAAAAAAAAKEIETKRIAATMMEKTD